MTAFEDLTLLRAFVRIVESGNISAAARTLRIPQPTLSRHLRTLEERCGTSLLRRDTHGMSLTETGHRLLADARAMLALADEAGQRLHDEQTVLRGHLHLFATIDGGQFTVSRMIAKFLKLHPGVTAELSYSNQGVRMIEAGCDAGVVAGRITDDSVVALPAGKIVRYIVATPEFLQKQPRIRKLADLQTWPWIALSNPLFGPPGVLTFRNAKQEEATLQVAPVMLCGGVTSMREMVYAGVGIAILPHWLVRDDIASGKLVRVLPQWSPPHFDNHVIYPAQRVLPARVRAFVDFAVAEMTAVLRLRD